MRFLYFHTSGKLDQPADISPIWTLLAVGVAEKDWRSLQLRINSLQKSFLRANYRQGRTILKPHNLLKPTNLNRPKTFGMLRGVQRISGQLGLTFFLVVVDKRKAHRPPSLDWVLPLCLRYIERPIREYLSRHSSPGAIILPESQQPISDHFNALIDPSAVPAGSNGASVYTGVHFQAPTEATGLQVASVAAALARVYHQEVAALLHNGTPLLPHQKCIEDLYQGFIKSNTWQPTPPPQGGHKGFIYLWRTPQQGPDSPIAEIPKGA